MDRAVNDLVQQILSEVDDRQNLLEKRLSEDFGRHTQEAVDKLWADVKGDGESKQAEFSATFSARFDALEENLRVTQAEFHTYRLGAEESKDNWRKPLEAAVGSLANLEDRVFAAEEAAVSDRAAAAADRATAESRHMELREACDRRLYQLQLQVKTLLDNFAGNDKQSNAEGPMNDLMELERLCSSHMAAAREAIKEVRKSQEELQIGLREEFSKTQATSKLQIASTAKTEDEMRGQIQVLREQTLNLSMRLSELAMPGDAQQLQNLSEEFRTETERSRERHRTVEQSIERTVLSGRSALEQMDTRCSRLQLSLTETQNLLRDDLSVLLEELQKSRISIDMQRFKTLGHSRDAAGVPGSDRSLANGRSPVDPVPGDELRGQTQVSTRRASRGGTTVDDDACTVT